MILTEVRVEKGEFTGWIRVHSISGGWGKFQGWVAWSSPFPASFSTSLLWPWPHLLFPWTTYPPCNSIFSLLHLPSQQALLPYLLGAWEVDQGRICTTGRAGTSQWAGIRDLELWLSAHAARVEGVQMAISFTVTEDCASLGTCLQLELMISLSFLWQLFLLLVFTVFSKCQWCKTNSEYSKTLHATLYSLPLCGKTRIFIPMPHFMA